MDPATHRAGSLENCCAAEPMPRAETRRGAFSRTTALAGSTVLAALGVWSIGAPGAHGASRVSCDDIVDLGVTPTEISVAGVGCRTGRRLANRVSKVRQAPYNGCLYTTGARIRLTSPCRKDGYRCRAISRGAYDSVRVSCNRGSRNVKWTLGG